MHVFNFSDKLARMAGKTKEIVEKGSEIYQGKLPEGAKEHH